MTTHTATVVAINTLSGTPDAPVDEDSITNPAAVLECDVTLSIDQIATCNIRLDKAAFISTLDERYMLDVYGGLGTSFRWLFGDITKIGFDGQGAALITAVGFRRRMTKAWGLGQYEYSGQTSDQIVRNLIEKCAIPSSLHSVQNSTWDPTTPASIFLNDGDIPHQLASDIVAQELRWMAEHSEDGAIYVGDIAITASVASINASTPGVVMTRDRTDEGLFNKIILTGARDSLGLELTSEASATSVFVDDPQEYWTLPLRYPLIQDQTQADAISARALAIYNVRPEYGSVITPLAGGIEPGDTITVTDAQCDLDEVDVFVTHVSYHLTAGTREIRWWRFPA